MRASPGPSAWGRPPARSADRRRSSRRTSTGSLSSWGSSSSSRRSSSPNASNAPLGTAGEGTQGGGLLEGRDLLALPEAQMRAVRGNDVAMVFQDPMTALNPVFKVGFQVMEPLRL